MSQLNVFTSSSLDRLVNRLSQQLQPSSPLTPQTIVVQSGGMARWISIELASLNGVCANIDFKFPNKVVEDIFSTVVPDLPEPSPFTAEVMTWRIMGLLPSLIDRPSFAPIRNYLSEKNDRKLLQLSRLIADTFDQYTIFRPELVQSWDRQQGEGWQPELWNELSRNYRGLHRAGLLQKLREQIKDKVLAARLPVSLDLFGISYLPPFHLELLNTLARVCQVNIYQLNPCGDFWGDIVSNKKLSSLPLFSQFNLDDEEYYETGNPLLSSLGTMGQEFFNLLLDYDAQIKNLDEHLPSRQQQNSLLGLIQSDILHLYDRSSAKAGGPTKLEASDHSLQVHSCHSPLREMEVLYDHLLQMFEEIPDLEPRHVIVMSPDLESYAPYITAVFGADSSDRPAIPYTIADRSQRRENGSIETFLSLLDLPSSRFGINQILDILESPAVLARFAIATEELETIRQWLRLTNVCWGIDANHRRSLGFPEYQENSWQAALERMLLGMAMPPDEDGLFDGILPCDHIEGRTSLTLGKLNEFFCAAVEAASQLKKPRTLSQWADALKVVTESMLADLNNELKPIFEVLQKLRDLQTNTGFSDSIELEALQEYILPLLDERGGAYGFLGGRVTFCAMLPMRSIPFRVICLTGMNDGSFPRTSRLPGFSLMSGKRRRGDRSLRDEDRYLFLEALLSARERLFISYTGQNIRDNSIIPPSVVVSELLDYILAGFVDINGEKIRIISHPLQSFSRSYFSADGVLFSYAHGICESLKLRSKAGRMALPFITVPLPEPEENLHDVELGQLLRFFANPSAWFLSKRFAVRPGRPDAEAEEREFFAMDARCGYQLRQELVNRLLVEKPTDDLFAASRAASLLPPLIAGEAAYEIAVGEATSFSKRLLPRLGKSLPPLELDLVIGPYRLTGVISNISEEHLVRYRPANMKGLDRLSIWLEHLALNCAKEHGYPCQSILICRDGELALPALEEAESILLNLLDCYRQGHRYPVPFFPESSWAFIDKSIAEAEKRWFGNGYDFVQPESRHPAYLLCFERQDPLDEQFEKIARVVYGPLKQALETQ